MRRMLILVLFNISITSLAYGAAHIAPQEPNIYIPDQALIAQINDYNGCSAMHLMHLPGQKPWSGDSVQLIAALTTASNGDVINMPADDRMFIYQSYSPLHYKLRIPHVPLLSYIIWRGNLIFAEQLAANPTFVSPTDQYGNTALHYLWQYMQRFGKYSSARKSNDKLPSAPRVLYHTQKLFKLLAPLINISNSRGTKPLTGEPFGLYPGKFITYVLGPSPIDPEIFELYICSYLRYRWLRQKERSANSCSLLDTTCMQTCDRPTNEAFTELLESLHQSFKFKSAVWKALSKAPTSALFPIGVRTNELQKIATELQVRTSGWISQLVPAREQELVLRDDLAALYDRLLKAAQKIDAPPRKAALLLELYRSAFATDGLPYDEAYNTIQNKYALSKTVEKTLLQLGGLGIKPTVRLCPDNANDTRTLFYVSLLFAPNKFLESHFSLLSLPEMLEEAALLQDSAEFTAKVEGAEIDDALDNIPNDTPHYKHWEALIIAVHNQNIRNRTLFELLLPQL